MPYSHESKKEHYLDGILIYFLDSHVPFNFPYLVISHLHHCHSDNQPTLNDSLPISSFKTKKKNLGWGRGKYVFKWYNGWWELTQYFFNSQGRVRTSEQENKEKK